MDSYVIALIISVTFLAVAASWQHKQTSTRLQLIPQTELHQFDIIDNELHDFERDTTADRFYSFRNEFLLVYGLVMAADWLQGSFIYSVYKNTLGLPEPVVASLFATAFSSAGISAIFIGYLVDRCGRKFMCQVYCILYSLSCLTILSSDLWLLYLGRALGGISTTLLYTAFETWMIAEYNRLGFGHSDRALSATYASMAILNGFIAMGSGVVAQVAVNLFDSEVTPFVVSIFCLSVAYFIISKTWVENYGSSTLLALRTGSESNLMDRVKEAVFTSLLNLIEDSRILAITFVVCFFEGAMYNMVYSWSQAILSARALAETWGQPPFGLIFASLMAALTLGSFFFAYMSRHGNSVQISVHMVQIALSASAISLLLTVLFKGEMYRFTAFFVFEFCVGMYFPSIAFLKMTFVKELRRGRVYGAMRVPLNAFIVLCMMTVEEGDRNREDRFMICSGLLLISVILVSQHVPTSVK